MIYMWIDLLWLYIGNRQDHSLDRGNRIHRELERGGRRIGTEEGRAAVSTWNDRGRLPLFLQQEKKRKD